MDAVVILGSDRLACDNEADTSKHGMAVLVRRRTGSMKHDCLPAAETAIALGDKVIVLRQRLIDLQSLY